MTQAEHVSDSHQEAARSVGDIPRSWVLVSLGLFLLAQLVGAFLRLLPLKAFPVDYNFLRFAHNHTVLTGWAMAGLYLALLSFLPRQARAKKAYGWIFWLNQACAVGMLLSFPIFGYKGISILFSTGALLVSYAFAWRLGRDGRRGSEELAWSSALWSQRFLVLASLGPWATAVLRARKIATPWPELAVNWYLHFLVQGFFTFALLSLLLHWLEVQGRDSETPGLRLSLLAWATLPAFAIPALALVPHQPWLWWLAWAAAILQAIAWLGLVPALRQAVTRLHFSNGWSKALLGLAATSFSLKVLLQSLGTVPALAGAALTRNLGIAYLHLIFIGFLSCFLFAWLIEHGLLRVSRMGLSLFLAGFALSEGLLLADGLNQWLRHAPLSFTQPALFAATLLLPIGTGLLLVRQLIGEHSGQEK